MVRFLITWKQDLDERLDKVYNPLEAAKEALKNITSGMSLGFTVIDRTLNKEYLVDLGESDENAVTELETKF